MPRGPDTRLTGACLTRAGRDAEERSWVLKRVVCSGEGVEAGRESRCRRFPSSRTSSGSFDGNKTRAQVPDSSGQRTKHCKLRVNGRAEAVSLPVLPELAQSSEAATT
jgi:hypothetical protein